MIWIIMGSNSDDSVMEEACNILKDSKIKYEKFVLSAHRTPEKLRKKIMQAKKSGVKIIIAGAGFAAALPGFIASYTDIPVLGVPIPLHPLTVSIRSSPWFRCRPVFRLRLSASVNQAPGTLLTLRFAF